MQGGTVQCSTVQGGTMQGGVYHGAVACHSPDITRKANNIIQQKSKNKPYLFRYIFATP